MHQIAHGGWAPALHRPGDAPGRVPPNAVDVVGEVHSPLGGRGHAERITECSEVALNRGILDVEARNMRERTAGEWKPPEAVTVGHAVFVPAGQ